MIFFSGFFYSLFAFLFKPIGLAAKISDKSLGFVGSLSSVAQACSRIATGFLYDRIGFKPIFFTLMLLNVVTSLICYWARNHQYAYYCCILSTYVVIAGIYALFPTAVFKTFGKERGAQIYTLVLLGGLVTAFTGSFLQKVIYPIIGA
mmetsp:Transcript_4692/g.7993  ORF Transcript_4692/g.7993 Transcript_4692/m.7993 type:complete len:148 (+) Transcript_4692:756-1199(+)|eukprot:CAMPEP_0168609954 /NCGR_PEP_ID=MMETSP0449_2-20121227/1504_1 /TAXON_ID=1082188 /ORGANISM="Strombidium rassoulzadegani, Strain ras09" /LENGTH=147 /DNA_ID=CAMNT_0008650177 /DNA_START=565 /DNA_END=1008 /DNA_ORIENTATION=-